MALWMKGYAVNVLATVAATQVEAPIVLPVNPIAPVGIAAIAMLSALFGVLAAMLVAIGLYGLLAYTVTRRGKEIGLRIAIGATGRDVIGMVLTSALGLVSVGLIIGVPMALWMKGYAANVLATVAATQAKAPITLPVNPIVPVMSDNSIDASARPYLDTSGALP